MSYYKKKDYKKKNYYSKQDCYKYVQDIYYGNVDITEDVLQNGIKALWDIIKHKDDRINALNSQILALSGCTKHKLNLKETNSISLYMYMKEFYPEIFKDHQKKVQASNKLKGLKFKSLKEAHSFLWDEYLSSKPEKVKKKQPTMTLSSWIKNIANPYRTINEYVSGVLIYLDYKGYIDYYGHTFNKLGNIKRRAFKFYDDEETIAILQEAIDIVGQYDNIENVKEMFKK